MGELRIIFGGALLCVYLFSIVLSLLLGQEVYKLLALSSISATIFAGVMYSTFYLLDRNNKNK